MSTAAGLSVKDVADRWGCKAAHILRLISRGQLRAVNVALSPTGKRPRWSIPPDAVDEFERRRASGLPKPERQSRRRNTPASEIIEFF